MKKKELVFHISLFIIALFFLALTIIFVKNDVLSAVIASLIGSAVTFIIGRIYVTVKNSMSQFAGYYRDEVFSRTNPAEIIKRDKFQLIEKDGNILSGQFTRYVPEKSRFTKWECAGLIVLDQFLLTYRATKDTTPSRGVILVKLNTARPNGLLPCYSGQYFKFEGENIVAHNINLIKIDKEEYDNI